MRRGPTSFEDFREVAGGVACPGQNFVYADVEGTIGYACTGVFPVRRHGDGTEPVPGWTAEHEWDGFIPSTSSRGRRTLRRDSWRRRTTACMTPHIRT